MIICKIKEITRISTYNVVNVIEDNRMIKNTRIIDGTSLESSDRISCRT
jgi:hypothetical protein